MGRPGFVGLKWLERIPVSLDYTYCVDTCTSITSSFHAFFLRNRKANLSINSFHLFETRRQFSTSLQETWQKTLTRNSVKPQPLSKSWFMKENSNFSNSKRRCWIKLSSWEFRIARWWTTMLFYFFHATKRELKIIMWKNLLAFNFHFPLLFAKII